MNNKIIYYLCHFDPGNDVDDETAFGHLVRKHLKHPPKYDVYMLVSVKTKNVDRLLKIGMKPYTGLDLNPEFNFENKIPLNNPTNKTLTIVFCDGTAFISPNYFPHFVLCCAPGLDSVIKESNLVNLCGFSHQGLLPDEPNGFNDIGSEKMIRYMIEKNVPHAFTTPFEAFKTLYCKKTFEFFEIPEDIWNQIAEDAFKMIIGRMPPSVPANVLPMAETLVNMRYAKTRGKPATNSRLALAIRELFTGMIMEVPEKLRNDIHDACVAYVDDLIKSALVQKSTVNPIENYDETIQSLFEMTIALAEVGMPCLDESGRLIYSSDGNLAKKYPEAFATFKRIDTFTPMYDHIAADKFIFLLEEAKVFE